MPYLPAPIRDGMDAGNAPISAGELNYLITTLCWDYLTKHGWPRAGDGGEPYHYADLNEVVGVLECVKLEIYRRVVAPYEDKKCAEHGDVYVP